MTILEPYEPIGVLADTHDNLRPLERCLKYFSQNRVRTILHAGDLVSPQTLEVFSSFSLYLAWGNNDIFRSGITEKARMLGFSPPQEHWFLHCGGKNILLTHGDNPRFFREVTSPENPRKLHYLIKGHTHFPEDYRRGEIRILNPGPLYRSDQYTAALFWPSQDLWQLYEIS
ncbi:MAG: YfcE family phosphodiesterase [Leptospiraceae bacterium]|nr:YfcE family phosphodiesterase [Leptospiraceae bacterium]MDW8305717.1 YfcE family phosphodiesterase [Leptospiraceae bacterium]